MRNRVAVVTGGSGQLGVHVVERLMREGARVHVPVFREDEIPRLSEVLGERFEDVRLHPDVDLTEEEEVQGLVRRVADMDGHHPEILLNLAGGFAMGRIEDTSAELWRRMWEVNATTAFLCSRVTLPRMATAGWGRIVNVSALPALDRGAAGMSAYGASKAAVLNLTHSLAREAREKGGGQVTVNAILPSIIDTPANRSAMPDADVSRWLPPGEIANVLAFLVSEGSRTVNGATLPLSL